MQQTIADNQRTVPSGRDLVQTNTSLEHEASGFDFADVDKLLELTSRIRHLNSDPSLTPADREMVTGLKDQSQALIRKLTDSFSGLLKSGKTAEADEVTARVKDPVLSRYFRHLSDNVGGHEKLKKQWAQKGTFGPDGKLIRRSKVDIAEPVTPASEGVDIVTADEVLPPQPAESKGLAEPAVPPVDEAPAIKSESIKPVETERLPEDLSFEPESVAKAPVEPAPTPAASVVEPDKTAQPEAEMATETTVKDKLNKWFEALDKKGATSQDWSKMSPLNS